MHVELSRAIHTPLSARRDQRGLHKQRVIRALLRACLQGTQNGGCLPSPTHRHDQSVYFKFVVLTRLADGIDPGRHAVIRRILSSSALRKMHTMSLLVLVPSPFPLINLLIACFCWILRSLNGCPTGRLLELWCKTIKRKTQ